MLTAGGRYFMLCFRNREPGALGPRRVTRDEIITTFTDGWLIDSIKPATIEITTDPAGIRGWLVTATTPRRAMNDLDGTEARRVETQAAACDRCWTELMSLTRIWTSVSRVIAVGRAPQHTCQNWWPRRGRRSW